MKVNLNEGLVLKTKLDEEDVLFLEKVVESFCLCLPIYNEISFIVLGKKPDDLIVVKSILMNESGKIEINEGEIIKVEQNMECKYALESGKGQFNIKPEGVKGTIFLPISKSNKSPLCVVKLIYKKQLAFKDDFSNDFGPSNLMDEIYNACYSKYMIDPFAFISNVNGKEQLNDSAKIFKGRMRAVDDNWFSKFWEDKEGTPPLDDIVKQRFCTGIDFEVAEFQFYLIAYPIYIGEVCIGMMISIAEISLIKNMLKEVINKSTIIKEVHHRVKNNLQTIASLLRLQTRRTNSYIVSKAFVESINRISSIALVYEALAREGENFVDMKECIKNILSMILGNMVEPNKAIKAEIRGQDVYLSGNQASNVSLCITELVQNALEHAFVFRKNGNIIVELKQINREIIITVEDDGVGLSGKKSKPGSLGLEIIRMITTESLKGNFKLESHTYGSVAEIRFPM